MSASEDRGLPRRRRGRPGLVPAMRETDLAKQRERDPKLSLFERLKRLEQLQRLEWETGAATTSRKGGGKR